MDQNTRILIANSLLAAAAHIDAAGKKFDPKAVEVANKTSRNLGAIGAKAVVPRVVRELANKKDRILDFGAGKSAAHAANLREDGFNVVAYDFGSNVNPEIHDPNALEHGPYDLVYASNVLNVQSSIQMLTMTLRQIRSAMAPGGIFVGNFPKEPRKMDATSQEVADVIKSVFGSMPMVVRPGQKPKAVEDYPAEPVFFIKKKAKKT